MIYEAARVRRDMQGNEVADLPQRFGDVADAKNYIIDSPISKDGNRPWIRNTTKAPIGQFLVIGGKEVSN